MTNPPSLCYNTSMGPLTEPFESIAHTLVKEKFNKTKTYHQHNPDVTYETAKCYGNQYITNHNIDERAQTLAKEFAEKNKSTQLEQVIFDIADDLKAKKAIPVNGELVYVRDNSSILAARKFLINDIYGVKNSTHIGDINIDARGAGMKVNETITFNIASSLDKLEGIQSRAVDLGKFNGKVEARPSDNEPQVVDVEGVSDER